MNGNNVSESWNGQATSANGAVVNNAGTTTVTNSVFSNNSSGHGGVFYNSGILTIGAVDGSDTNVFMNNHAGAGYYGGVICNGNTLIVNSGTVFAGIILVTVLARAV